MTAIHVSEKGQVTLPAKLRRKLGIKPKSMVVVEERGEEIVLRPIKSIMDLSGILHEYAKGKTTDWETIREETMKAVVQEYLDENK